MSEQIIKFYVTVGLYLPGTHPLILADKTMLRIDPDTETLVKRAKMLRKEMAEGKTVSNEDGSGTRSIRPSELFYEVYTEAASIYPYACSANSPAMNSAV